MKNYENLKNIIAGMEQDIQKFNDGNNAAGTRIRKQLQDLKKEANNFRGAIQEIRESRKG